MAELQAATALAWGEAASLQNAAALAWGDAVEMQSRGSAYVAPAPGTGVIITPGGLTPLRDIVAATRYVNTAALEVVDLRDESALPVTSVSLDLSDGSDLWTLQAAGTAALATALRAGEQPATIEVRLGADAWRFVVEEIDQPLTFQNTDVTIRGRSLAAAAGAPYQAVQTWVADAPITAAQIAALANTYTGVAVDWDLVDWLVPAGAWSASADPLAVVRQMAAAVGAVVEAHRTEMKVSVRSRYPRAPNLWATTQPDVQIAWLAVESARRENADQPAYDGVLVAGLQTGGLLQARLEGTSGSLQAPMVTDQLLTDTAAQIERAGSLLHSFGGRARETRTLQLHGGVVARGALVRCVESDATWTGMVRAVSVTATLEQARQTITMERPTSFVLGSVAPEPVPAALVLAAVDSGEVGTPGTATVTNSGGSAADWTLSATPSGLTATPSSGTTLPNESTSVALSYASAATFALELASAAPVSGSPQSIVVAAGGPPPSDILLFGAFTGTDGQTASIPNDGFLGGVFPTPTRGALSNTVPAGSAKKSFSHRPLTSDPGLSFFSISSASLSVPLLTAVTLEAYMQVEANGLSAGDEYGIVNIFWIPANNTGMDIRVSTGLNASTFRVRMVINGGVQAVAPVQTLNKSNTAWCHVAMCAQPNNSMSAFINGVLVGSAGTRSAPSGSVNCGLLFNQAATSNYPTARVANLRVIKNFAYPLAGFTPPAVV